MTASSGNKISLTTLAVRLAADAACDVRTARKAIAHGTDGLRPLVRERVVRSALRLDIPLGQMADSAESTDDSR